MIRQALTCVQANSQHRIMNRKPDIPYDIRYVNMYHVDGNLRKASFHNHVCFVMALRPLFSSFLGT